MNPQSHESFNGRYACLFGEKDQKNLEDNLKGLSDNVKDLKDEIRTTGKWLIAALIVIALGRTGIELLQEYTGKSHKAQTEGSP